jgi:hypothetical protein
VTNSLKGGVVAHGTPRRVQTTRPPAFALTRQALRAERFGAAAPIWS